VLLDGDSSAAAIQYCVYIPYIRLQLSTSQCSVAMLLTSLVPVCVFHIAAQNLFSAAGKVAMLHLQVAMQRTILLASVCYLQAQSGLQHQTPWPQQYKALLVGVRVKTYAHKLEGSMLRRWRRICRATRSILL